MIFDHLILNVNDLDESRRFYTEVPDPRDEGTDAPFAVLRVAEAPSASGGSGSD